MKRTTFLLLVVFLFGFGIQNPASACEISEFEIIKGDLIDEDGDGIWDGLGFFVVKKKPKVSLPVLSVSLVDFQSQVIQDFSFNLVSVSKKVDEYYIDLSGGNISGDFLIAVGIDLSDLYPESDDDGQGGPGSKPSETIIVIEWP